MRNKIIIAGLMLVLLVSLPKAFAESNDDKEFNNKGLSKDDYKPYHESDDENWKHDDHHKHNDHDNDHDNNHKHNWHHKYWHNCW